GVFSTHLSNHLKRQLNPPVRSRVSRNFLNNAQTGTSPNTSTIGNWIVIVQRPLSQAKRAYPALRCHLLFEVHQVIPLHCLFRPPISVSRNQMVRAYKHLFSLDVRIATSDVRMNARQGYFPKVSWERTVGASQTI